MSLIKNIRWLSISQFALLLSQVINMFVIARILSPADYGLMALATIFSACGLLFQDFGLSTALIQKRQLSDDTISTVFWFNLAIAITLATTLFSSSSHIEQLFSISQLSSVLCLLSLIFPISTTSMVQKAILERDSAFSILARIEFTSVLFAIFMAFISAIYGAGVYSLVIQTLTNTILTSVQLWYRSNWRPRFHFSFSELKQVLNFGSLTLGSNFISTLADMFDTMIIGRVVGDHALGLYTQAYKIIMIPVQNIAWISSRALFPIMSRRQDEEADVIRLYFRTIRIVSFATAPLIVGLIIMREHFVALTLGEKWLAITDILVWLAPIGYLRSIDSISASVLNSRGKPNILLNIAIVNSIVKFTTTITGCFWGIEGVAIGVLCAFIICVTNSVRLVLIEINRSFKDLLSHITPSIVSAVLMGIILYSIKSGLNEESSMLFTNHILSLLINCFLGSLTYLTISYFFYQDEIKKYRYRSS